MQIARTAVGGFVAGAVLLASAWAGVGLTPTTFQEAPHPAVEHARPPSSSPLAGASAARLPDGRFLTGVHRVSIAPDPDRWTPDVPEGTCAPVDPDPGCIMTFDLRYAKEVLEPGVWARAMAISNGEETVVLISLDVIGWFYGYPADVCGDCGAREIREDLGGELGIPGGNIVLTSTHTHASGNTVGLLGPAGFVPNWYYEQIRDATKEAVRGAVSAMQASGEVRIEVGETIIRTPSRDRRRISRSVPDNQAQWLRTVTDEGRTVGVLYSYAAHPTVLTANDTLHSGLVGPANDRIEEQLDAEMALFVPGGLGDRRVRRGLGRDGLGHLIADAVLLDIAQRPRLLASNEIRGDVYEIDVPVDNVPVAGMVLTGLFNRSLLPPHGGGPASGRWGKADVRPTCASAAPVSARTSIGGLRIGEAAFMISPGEIFSSISLVVRDELHRAAVTFVAGLANDELGYIIPANQFDVTAQQGVGLAASAETSEYEEVLSVSRCFGEQVMDELIASGSRLGF